MHDDFIQYAMTVGKLREALEGLPDSLPVILQEDSEGNGYRVAHGASNDNVVYVPEGSWWGQVYLKELTPELTRLGYTEEDCAPEGFDCLVIGPVN